MTLATAPFYWLTCDAPDCEQREPGAFDEILAWSDPEAARESASASDWEVARKHDVKRKRDYCPDHAPFVCERCGKLDLTPLPGERDYLCTEHAAQEERTP